MPADVAAQHQVATIERTELAAVVPEAIREYFDRVRRLHVYGLLEYEFFSAACDLSLFAIEAALRVRFVEFYAQRLPVIAKGRRVARGTPPEQLTTFRGAEATHLVRSFDDVWKAAPHWQLRSDRGVHPIPTNLAALLAWARREGLLPGRRSRNMDRPLGALRNFAAHPTHYTLQTPPDSSRAIARSAEVINKLWGVDTPGGYLFSGPIRREPRVIGIDPVNHRALAMRVDQVTGLSQPETNYHFLVLLVPPEEDLWNLVGGPGPEFVYRRGVERTRYPCHELFSGSYDQLIAEIAAGAFDSAEDAVEYLDRRFLIRLLDGDLDDVRTPQDLLDVPHPLDGTWLAIIADSPLDARYHAAQHREIQLDGDGTCPECMVEVSAELSDWSSAVAWATAHLV